ncbi:MAG: class I SAM-dependent methyltransferase [Jatrophihabitans sp.]
MSNESRNVAVDQSTFETARLDWLDSETNVRNVVRQEMIARQLSSHIAGRTGRVLDVGAGQGMQSIRLARAGHEVVAVEPDPEMRRAFQANVVREDADVRNRIELLAGSIGELPPSLGDATYDTVLLLGVLMYMPESRSAIAQISRCVAPGGVLAVAVRTPVSALWRPAARQDWTAALAAFDEYDDAHDQGRDMRYVNEIGAPARCDDIDSLTAECEANGLRLEQWYGVRIAVDTAETDPRPPTDATQLAALFDVEERLGRTDPYRQLGQLAHLILRRSPPV